MASRSSSVTDRMCRLARGRRADACRPGIPQRRATRSFRSLPSRRTSPSPMSGASRSTLPATRLNQLPMSQVRSRRWRSTSWYAAIERGGLRPGRIPPCVPNRPDHDACPVGTISGYRRVPECGTSYGTSHVGGDAGERPSRKTHTGEDSRMGALSDTGQMPAGSFRSPRRRSPCDTLTLPMLKTGSSQIATEGRPQSTPVPDPPCPCHAELQGQGRSAVVIHLHWVADN